MNELLQHPAVQAGAAPFVVALVTAVVLQRVRAAWLAVVAGYLVAILLTTGVSFQPLTASRKVLLLVLLAPLAGLLFDRLIRGKAAAILLPAVLAAVAAPWALASVLAQKEGLSQLVVPGAGLAVFAAALVALTLRLRDDGIATAAAGIGLGAGVGVAALLSASTGYFTSGLAVAAGSGALMLLQFVAGRAFPAGSLGGLPIALGAALFASAALMLAQLPWYALPALLLVPVAAALSRARSMTVRQRAVVLTVLCLAASAAPMLAAWHAAQRAS